MDSEAMAALVKEMVSMDNLAQTSECSIFRVSNMLRRDNEKAFMPELVSIGPFHHENKQLQAMRNIKLRYLKCFLYRTSKDLEYLANAMGSIEQDCRKCYAEVVDLSREKFIEMMLIDGCFILEFLYRYMENKKKIPTPEGSKGDPVFKTAWTQKKIIADLLLLENQLPWGVLDCLFKLMLPSLETNYRQGIRVESLDDLVSFSFDTYQMFSQSRSARSREEHAHLLDCFRNCLVGSCSTTILEASIPIFFVPAAWNLDLSVTELLDFGVRCRVGKKGDNILDVNFENERYLKIPRIIIEENTESVFRNLIAFEHCDPSKGFQITSYAALLACLIKSPADALLLKKNLILQTGLSNEETTSFLYRLHNHDTTSVDGFLYFQLYRRLSQFQSRTSRRYQATLRRDYFKDPSTFFTLMFGIVFSLFLGILQTIFSILSYYK